MNDWADEDVRVTIMTESITDKELAALKWLSESDAKRATTHGWEMLNGRIDVPQEIIAALIERLERAEAERDALRVKLAKATEALKKAQSAVSCSYEQAQAEYQGHDRRAGRLCDAVDSWRKDTRAVLTEIEDRT